MSGGLKTPRLVLRPLDEGDLDELAALHAEPSFWWYPLGRGQTEDETREFVRRQVAAYQRDGLGFQAVVDKASGTLAGWAGLSVPAFLPEVLPAIEVGWRLGLTWRGKGYATEAGAAWVRWAFDNRGWSGCLAFTSPITWLRDGSWTSSVSGWKGSPSTPISTSHCGSHNYRSRRGWNCARRAMAPRPWCRQIRGTTNGYPVSGGRGRAIIPVRPASP